MIVRRIPGRDALLGPALALGALAAVLLALRGAAQVLPLGVVLACALALVILAPGLAAARVVGVDDVIDAPVLVAIAVPLGCAVWALALMAGIILQLPLAAVAIAVFLFTGVATGRARAHMRAGRATAAWLGGAGLLLAAAASRLESGLHGDELFHAGRVRKLIDLPHLSLSGLSSVWHGSPHAGYVVPVLHAIDAAAIRITGADPSTAYPHLAPGCALLLPIAAYALGAGVGRNAGIATAAFASWDALARSSLESLQQPPEFTFFVLIPAWLGVLAVDARSRQPNRPLQRALLLSLLAITLIHATYAVVPLAALIAVTIVTRRGWRLLAACLSLTGVIYAVIWAVALRGGQHLPGPRVLSTVYLKAGGHPFVAQAHWMLTARPEIALAVLAVLPLMLLFRRRHVIAASVMAGALVLSSFPGVPDLLLHVFGYGQVKRFPRNGLPWTLTAAIVVGELAAATRRGSLLAAAAALAVASLGYQAGVPEGTPLTLAIAALTIAAVVTGVAIGIRRLAPGRTDTPVAPVAAVLLLALAVAAGSIRADASRVVSDLRHGPALQTAALPRIPAPVIAFFRHHDQTRPVVLAESYIGYQLAGEADVYPVALPLERSRGEARNDPVARRRAVNMALAPGAPNTLRRRILTRYHAGYVLINQTTTPHAAAGLDADPDLRRVLTYRTWIAYRVDTFRTTT